MNKCIAIISLILTVTFISCKKQVHSNELIGIWENKSIKEVINFQSNGNLKIDQNAGKKVTIEGTYEVNLDTIKFSYIYINGKKIPTVASFLAKYKIIIDSNKKVKELTLFKSKGEGSEQLKYLFIPMKN